MNNLHLRATGLSFRDVICRLTAKVNGYIRASVIGVLREPAEAKSEADGSRGGRSDGFFCDAERGLARVTRYTSYF